MMRNRIIVQAKRVANPIQERSSAGSSKHPEGPKTHAQSCHNGSAGFRRSRPTATKPLNLAKLNWPFRSLALPAFSLAAKMAHTFHLSPITNHLYPPPLSPLDQKGGQLRLREKGGHQTLRGTKPKAVTERGSVDHAGIGPILL